MPLPISPTSHLIVRRRHRLSTFGLPPSHCPCHHFLTLVSLYLSPASTDDENDGRSDGLGSFPTLATSLSKGARRWHLGVFIGTREEDETVSCLSLGYKTHRVGTARSDRQTEETARNDRLARMACAPKSFSQYPPKFPVSQPTPAWVRRPPCPAASRLRSKATTHHAAAAFLSGSSRAPPPRCWAAACAARPDRAGAHDAHVSDLASAHAAAAGVWERTAVRTSGRAPAMPIQYGTQQRSAC
jgi:hypothetical protein